MNFPSFSLDGKRALVTGASKGIGRHAALSLAHAGAEVVLTARDVGELEEAATEIGAMGREAEVIAADLAQPEEIERLAEKALAGGKNVDILVNNAGLSILEPAVETTVKNWDYQMAVNLRAPMMLSKFVGRRMIEAGGGKIINMASQAGIIGLTEHAAYCASKAGLILLTKVLAIEWGPHNIQVNAVAPTVILTPLGERSWADPAKREAMLAKIPLGRFGLPEDVSGAVVYLASSAADLVTGEVLLVDGGYTAG